MHVVKLLHKQLEKTCTIHKKRLSSLFDIVETAMRTQYVTLTGLGRRLPTSTILKHKIKKVDRLLGNKHLQKERIEIYKQLGRLLIGKRIRPLIIVDWSPLAEGSYYYLIRASIPTKGRAITLYEECHRDSDHTNTKIHKAFLKTLKMIVSPDCQPIIITDAGFRNSWFKMVEALNWHWVGRVRNGTLYHPINSAVWSRIKSLYPSATSQAKRFGQVILARSNPITCYFYLYKKHPGGRKKVNLLGEPCRQSTSLKCAKREREPWLIASSLEKPAKNMIQLYSKRTQIENSFRDTKNQRVGFSLNDTGTRQIERLNILLLIIFIASIGLWLIGQCAKEKNLQYQFQANTVKHREVLSNIYLGWQILFSLPNLLSSRDIKQTLHNFMNQYSGCDL
jgi:hypothetical protein